MANNNPYAPWLTGIPGIPSNEASLAAFLSSANACPSPMINMKTAKPKRICAELRIVHE